MTAATLAPPATLRAARYLRISDDKNEDEAGVGRQDTDTAGMVTTRCWELAGTYTDNDQGATKGKRREDYERLMAAAARREFDVIVVFHLSRLWRNRVERAQGIEVLRHAGVSVVCVKGPSLDLSTAYGRGMAAMLGEFDTMEAEIHGERQSRAMRDNAEAGLHLGGAVPFGWRAVPDPARKGRPDADKLVLPLVDEVQAAAIRKAAAGVLEGRSLASLAQEWNDSGIRTPYGKTWSVTSLRKVLLRERNTGTVTFSGASWPGAWPAILDEDTWRKVVTVLTDPERKVTTTNRVRHLLSGIAECGVCHQPVHTSSAKARSTGKRRRIYVCPNHVARKADAVDEVVTEHVLVLLSTATREQRLALLAQEDVSSPQAAEATRLRGKLAELLDMWESEEITRAEYKARSASLRAQLRAAEAAMAKVAKAPVVADLLTAGDVRAAWEAMPLDRRRSVLAEMVVVSIQPARRGWTYGRAGAELTEESVGIEIVWDAAYRLPGEQVVDPVELFLGEAGPEDES